MWVRVGEIQKNGGQKNGGLVDKKMLKLLSERLAGT
jgi:hypothetical protein